MMKRLPRKVVGSALFAFLALGACVALNIWILSQYLSKGTVINLLAVISASLVVGMIFQQYLDIRATYRK